MNRGIMGQAKTYLIGYFHIDIAEVRTAEGKLHLYVGIDRAPQRLHRCLQLWTTAQDPQGPHTLRIHLQNMDKRAKQI